MRATAIGLASVMALGVGLASPALGGMMGGGGGGGGAGGMMHSSSGGGGGGGGMMHSSGIGGGMSSGVVLRSSGPSFSGASFSGVKSGGPGPAAGMRQMSMTRMGDRDHFDHDRDHDRRFRFFPSFAFNTYYDSSYPDYGDCWDIRRVHTPLGWRWHRVWVCGYNYSY